MFLFINPKSVFALFDGGAMPVQKYKSTLLEQLTAEQQPYAMFALLLIMVMLLHIYLGIWLLNPTEHLPEIKPLKVIEVALLSEPSHKSAIPATTAPKPIPPKKPVVKKAGKKKLPVTKKTANIPTPQPVPIIEEKHPSLTPVLPDKPPARSEAKPVSKPVDKVSNERINSKTVISGVVPLVRAQPRYPSRAVSRHIEGWVKIEFTISTVGTVTDPTIVASQPAEIFDYEALKAIKKWKFKEKIVNGVAVEQRAIQTLQFKLVE
jgi:periplasmic protein TonB